MSDTADLRPAVGLDAALGAPGGGRATIGWPGGSTCGPRRPASLGMDDRTPLVVLPQAVSQANVYCDKSDARKGSRRMPGPAPAYADTGAGVQVQSAGNSSADCERHRSEDDVDHGCLSPGPARYDLARP
jgi:hypothetical protein